MTSAATAVAVARTSAAQVDAVTRLRAMVAQREILLAPFRQVWGPVAEAAAADERDAWAKASLTLAHVNVGPTALVAFWRISAADVARLGVRRLVAMAEAAADVCRAAGAQAARSTLEARIQLSGTLHAAPPDAEATWWRALVRLAREAPDCVTVTMQHAARLLAAGAGGFETFVAAGLRSSGGDKARRIAFFKLEDPRARQLIERLSGTVGFGDLRPRLAMFAKALWGAVPPIQTAGLQPDGHPIRRASIAGGVVRVPDVFRGIPATDAPALFRAAVAHATAHLALGPGRFTIGSLRPLQIVLVGLVEDARIEALAMRRFPGLRRLWAPFHVAVPSSVTTATVLLARLSRALFDPDYTDHDGFVAKGRALFAAEPDLNDSALSRRIGGLLGNDLGQMRIQFNAKTYVVEPPYRDDGLGLWDFPQPPDAPPDDSEIHVEAARSASESAADRKNDRSDEAAAQTAGRARAVEPDDHGVAVATYPEWDRAADCERPDWTTVREIPAALGDPQAIDLAIEREADLRVRVERLVRSAKVGRMKRLRRQPEGTDFDLDAVIDAAIELRQGVMPDERVHRLSVPQIRDVAVLVLTDTSESTRDTVPAAGTSVMAIERLAVAVLASAMASLGDTFALRAFASKGRDEVRVTRVKDFDQPFGVHAKARLAGLQPGLSTRLGAALRHAGAELGRVRATRKLLLVLTDGAPSDIDVPDPLDLIEDARRAVLRLRSLGIDVFGIVLDPSGHGAGAAVFGRSNHLALRRIEQLPSRLAELYFRLARR